MARACASCVEEAPATAGARAQMCHLALQRARLLQHLAMVTGAPHLWMRADGLRFR